MLSLALSLPVHSALESQDTGVFLYVLFSTNERPVSKVKPVLFSSSTSMLLRKPNKWLAVHLVHTRALFFNPAEHLNWRTPLLPVWGAKGDILGQLSLVLGCRSHFFWVLRWCCQGLVKLLICLDKMSHRRLCGLESSGYVAARHTHLFILFMNSC